MLLLQLAAAADGPSGSTTLHSAAAEGRLSAVKQLLKNGAPVDAADSATGETPLHRAASHSHVAVISALLGAECERGTALAVADQEGNTALHAAASAEAAHELLRCSSDLQLHLALNKHGHSPMHVAAWEGRVDVLNRLAASVPSPARSRLGPAWAAWEGEGAEQTPLLMAAYRGHGAAVQELLRHAFCTVDGASLKCPRAREPAAKRALARVLAAAEAEGHEGAAKVLKRSGARRMGAKELEVAAEAAAAAAEKQAEGEGGARGAGVGRAEQGSPFAALLRSDKEYRDFALDLKAQYATIGELLGAKLPSPHAPNVRYREADADAPGSGGSSGGGGGGVADGGGGGGGGSLGARLPSMLFRPALMATTAAHRASLRAKGYAVVGPVFEAPVLATLRRHFHALVDSGALRFSDPQSKRYVARNEKVSRLVHEDLTPLVSLLAGRAVAPTYTYFSGYVAGSELPLHTDRDDCEYTVSYLLQRGPPGAAWPIHLERKVTPGLTPGPKRHTVPPDARTSLDSAENEFMIFKGRHHAHWRQKFAGNYSYILLLHYVHRTEEQALLRNGDEASARGTDVAAALAGLGEGERLLRADGGEVPKKAASFVALEENDTSLEYVLVLKGEHFFYPGRFVGHRQTLQHTSPPLTLESLSLSPRVFRVDGFLSSDECRHIMRLATPALRPSILHSRGHPQQVEGGTIDPMRTSETAWLDRFFGVNRGAPETDVTRAVVARAVALARVPGDTHAEGLQVLRYSVGGKYRHHVDWLEGHHPARLATVLIFLNDGEATGAATDEFGKLEGGGGTNFALRHSESYPEMLHAGCEAGLTVEPKAGTAVFFYNMHPHASATSDYSIDWTAWHSGCSVTAGVKWVANVWIRNDETEW